MTDLIAAPMLQNSTPQAVYWIWGVTLLVAAVMVLVIVVFLHRILRAARQIERYFADMAQAGAGIADNTQHVAALEETIAIATRILSVAGTIDGHSATIKETLAGRAAGANGNGAAKGGPP